MTIATHPLPRFLPRRAIGNTGFVATAIGVGDLADPELGLERCVAIARRALDAGINVIDTASGYADGLSERVVGAAVADVRARVFVIDKIDDLDGAVEPQIEASLERLGDAGAPDLFVFHDVSRVEQWERIAAPGGAMEALGDARARGKCRFRGVSSHHPDVVRRAIESGTCDVVMFAVGPFVDARYVGELLPLARARGVGVVSFKTFGGGKLLGDTRGYGQPLESGRSGLPRMSVEECVRATLTFDPDVALLGLSNEAEQDAALPAAAQAASMSDDELRDVQRRAALAIEGKGTCWWNPPPAR